MSENVNSAYAKSAHIPLSKLTARNTQRKAKTFTKQATERYVENLTISSALYDILQDDLARLSASEDSNTPGQWKLWGQSYTITWPAGHARPIFQWFCPSPGDHPYGDSLQGQVMHYLGQHILPYIPDGKLQCCTEFISAKGNK